MRHKVDAIYENGLLRLLTPLELADCQRVSVTVETMADESWLDEDALEWADHEGDPSISLEDVRGRLAKLPGSLSDLVIAERGDY